MTQIVLDQGSLAKLATPNGMVEVCDSTGKVFGYFHPLVNPSLYQDVQVPFTEEELDRFEQEPEERRLADILADLERRA